MAEAALAASEAGTRKGRRQTAQKEKEKEKKEQASGSKVKVVLGDRSLEDHTNFTNDTLNDLNKWHNFIIYERKTETYYMIEDVNLDEDKGKYGGGDDVTRLLEQFPTKAQKHVPMLTSEVQQKLKKKDFIWLGGVTEELFPTTDERARQRNSNVTRPPTRPSRFEDSTTCLICHVRRAGYPERSAASLLLRSHVHAFTHP